MERTRYKQYQAKDYLFPYFRRIAVLSHLREAQVQQQRANNEKDEGDQYSLPWHFHLKVVILWRVPMKPATVGLYCVTRQWPFKLGWLLLTRFLRLIL